MMKPRNDGAGRTMEFDDCWKAEESFWLDGPEFYERRMAPSALMVFPPPVGILAGDQILVGLKQGPRWQSVDLEERSQTGSETAVVLAYKATGKRPHSEPYIALCSSTYIPVGGVWKLLSHQQTPAE